MSLYNGGLSAICDMKEMVRTISIIYGMKWNYKGRLKFKHFLTNLEGEKAEERFCLCITVDCLLSVIWRKWYEQFQSFMAWNKMIKDIFRWKALKEPKRVTLDTEFIRVVYSNALHRKNLWLGFDNWKKLQSFYEDKKISDKCTWSEGSRNLPEELKSA
jgi:hypothetical protein